MQGREALYTIRSQHKLTQPGGELLLGLLTLLTMRCVNAVRNSHCHVFLGGLDPGQAPPKALLLILRLTESSLSLF